MKINAETVLAYIPERKGVGIANRTINMELGILRRILKKAKRWYLVADDMKLLPERQDAGRALAHEEKVRLLKTAGSRPEWQTAYLAAVLALNTTMRSCEIRGLRWRDLDFIERAVTVRRSKTEAGERVIPLNDEAWTAVISLRDRAKTLFGDSIAADWYVFPHAEGNTAPNPRQPMSSWRTAWRALTRSVICPDCGVTQLPAQACRNEKCKADIHTLESPLAGLRFHDLRHHAITELAESESTSEQTIMAIAGHVTTRMLRHYSHVRRDAMRRAVESLNQKRAAGSQTDGYVTKHGTKPPAEGTATAQVLENVVDVAGIEPATPCLQSRCSPS
jgi:integrase